MSILVSIIVGLTLLAVARGLMLGGLTLFAFIFGFRKLARGDWTGWPVLAAGCLIPGYFGVQWIQSNQTIAHRTTEIASWPRAKVTAADRPRTLIVRGYDTLPPVV